MSPNYAFGDGFSIVTVLLIAVAALLIIGAMLASRERPVVALLMWSVGSMAGILGLLLFGFEWSTMG